MSNSVPRNADTRAIPMCSFGVHDKKEGRGGGKKEKEGSAQKESERERERERERENVRAFRARSSIEMFPCTRVVNRATTPKLLLFPRRRINEATFKRIPLFPYETMRIPQQSANISLPLTGPRNTAQGETEREREREEERTRILVPLAGIGELIGGCRFYG